MPKPVPQWAFSLARMAATLQLHGWQEPEDVMRRWVVLMGVVGLLAGPMQTNAEQAVSISVKPAVTGYRGTVRLRVLVARDDTNRLLRWEVDGSDYFRASQRELDGAAAARTHEFFLRDLPAGHFEVRAIVTRSDRSSVMDQRTLRVIGGPSEP